MRLATTTLALLVILASLPAWGLSLGEVTIHSQLGQPLVAEIPIRNSGGISPDQLQARLADTAEMQARDIAVNSIPRDIHIEVLGRDRPTQIYLTTHVPIREPGFELLLKTEWPNGSMMRRYQLLFTPFH